MSWSECCGRVVAFYAACQRHMIEQFCCGSGSTNKLFSSASYFDRKSKMCHLPYRTVFFRNQITLYMESFA